jgi:hypothetical protein
VKAGRGTLLLCIRGQRRPLKRIAN